MSNLFQAIPTFFQNVMTFLRNLFSSFKTKKTTPEATPVATPTREIPKNPITTAAALPLEAYAPPYGTPMRLIADEREYKAYIAKYKEFPPIGNQPPVSVDTGIAIMPEGETLAQAAQKDGFDAVQIQNLLFVAYKLTGKTNADKLKEYKEMIGLPTDEEGWAKWRENFAKNKGHVINDGVIPEVPPTTVGGAAEPLPGVPAVFKKFYIPEPRNTTELAFNDIMKRDGYNAAYTYALENWNFVNIREPLIKAGADPQDVSRVINQIGNQGQYFSDVKKTRVPRPIPTYTDEVGDAKIVRDHGA